jgi:hypothetical protein
MNTNEKTEPLDTTAIRARAEAATEGPWEQRQNAPTMSGAVWHLRRAGQPGVRAMVTEYQHGSANAEFIAHARTDVPALCDALDEARQEIERLRARWAVAWEYSDHELMSALRAEAERDRLAAQVEEVMVLRDLLAYQSEQVVETRYQSGRRDLAADVAAQIDGILGDEGAGK